MVRLCPCAVLIVCTSLMTMDLRAQETIHSVRVVSDSVVHIKPYQPVFIVLEVTMRLPAEEKPLRDVPLELSREVVVNGKSYGISFDANPVALFELDRSTIRRPDHSTIQFQVLGFMFMNFLDHEFVFKFPGRYDIRFSVGASLTVVVDRPTPAEEKFIGEIEGDGKDFAALIGDDNGQSARAILPRLETWLRTYGETDYAGLMSIRMGQVKLSDLREQYRARNSSDMASLTKESGAIMTEFFGPHCSGSISAPYQAEAAYRMAQGLLDQVRYEVPGEESDKLKVQAASLLKGVAESPFSIQQRGEAKSKLVELETAQVAPARP